MLQLFVKTRNSGGIAARSPICINFGAEFDLSYTAPTEEADSKKFKGMLDSYFEKKKEAEAAKANEEHGGVSPAEEEERKKERGSGQG